MKLHLLLLMVIVAVTLLLPWLAVTFVPEDAGMAVCLVLFYAVNPLLAAGTGVLAELRREWWWPVVTAAAFLLGAWLLFAPGEMAFLIYAGVYLALGWIAMTLARLARK